MEDWEKKLYKKFVQSRVTNPRELKGDTIWESEQWLTGSPRELIVFIQNLLDKAKKEIIFTEEELEVIGYNLRGIQDMFGGIEDEILESILGKIDSLSKLRNNK